MKSKDKEVACVIQYMGDNLANRLDDFVNSGGDVHSVVQAMELCTTSGNSGLSGEDEAWPSQ